MGGPIAQQLASSLLMRAADRASADAYDAHLRGDTSQQSAQNLTQTDQTIPGHGSATGNANLNASTQPNMPQFDQYWSAFLNAGFSETAAPAEKDHAISSAVNAESRAQFAHAVTPNITSSALIGVETWNLLLGEEKLAMLKQALQRGTELPPAKDWTNWQVAVGAAREAPQTAVTFLVPPELGYLRSGQEVMVELASPGDIGMARYVVTSGRN